MEIRAINDNFDNEDAPPEIVEDLTETKEEDLPRLAANGEEEAIFELIKRHPELGGGLEWDKAQ